MGAFCSRRILPEERYAYKTNMNIERELEMSHVKHKSFIKLLLLGAGGSGKSTIFRQIKMLYNVPLTEPERKRFNFVVHRNTLMGMKILVEKVERSRYTVAIKQEKMQKILDASPDQPICEEIGQIIEDLWGDAGVKQIWNDRDQFQIDESCAYFFDNISRIMLPHYVASSEDLIFARFRSSGIKQERIKISNTSFEIYDVGGQRNERRKWIHCFDDVTAVIFVAALSEYNQVLFEDATKNRVIEAIELFSEICNNAYFKQSSMILFLNKVDLFREKIKIHDIKSVEEFEDFPGGLGDVDLGINYFLDLFLGTNQNPKNHIFHHVTCAVDTQNIKTVFSVCKSTIIRHSLSQCGLMEAMC